MKQHSLIFVAVSVIVAGIVAVLVGQRLLSLTPPKPTMLPRRPSWIAQAHALTAAYFQGFGGSTSVSPTQAAPYLSFGFNVNDSNTGDYVGEAAVTATGIKAMYYMDAQIEYSCSGCSQLYRTLQANPQFIAKCSSTNISFDGNGGEVADLSANSSGWEVISNNYLSTEFTNYPGYWAWFADDASPLSWGANWLPCNPGASSTKYAAAQYEPYIASLLQNYSGGKPVIANLFSSDALNATQNQAIVNQSNVLGGMAEDCYSVGLDGAFGLSNGSPVGQAQSFYGGSTDVWTALENESIWTQNHGKLFFCLSNASTGASTSIPVRTYVYASFMLTYSPEYSVLLEELGTNTARGLSVFPETGIVPTGPLVATPSSIAGLKVGNVYLREYSDCYYRGADEGPCAAVVNPTASTQNWPTTTNTYYYTLIVSGGGVLESPTVNFNGAVPPATLAGTTAVIAFAGAPSASTSGAYHVRDSNEVVNNALSSVDSQFAGANAHLYGPLIIRRPDVWASDLNRYLLVLR